jgi:hypothetical protein
MTEITTVDEVTRDWDWFAVDASGAVGHFTTAGMRKLPSSVKADNEAALRLIDYFDQDAQKQFDYVVRVQAEIDAGTLKDIRDRNWYLRSFVAMASAGLFSYDTDIEGRTTDYFLVAYPKSPLQVDQLPSEVREMVQRTRSKCLFSESPHISEAETRSW